MFVVFMVSGKTYRIDVTTDKVEEFTDSKTWKQVRGGRIVRTARMEKEEWLKVVGARDE